MAGRHTRGYEDIVVIFPDGERWVCKCEIPSPPPEELDIGFGGLHRYIEAAIGAKLDYIGTIWETPHYRLRAEM